MDLQQIVTHLVSMVGTLAAVGYAVLRGLKWIGAHAIFPLVAKLVARHLAFLDKLEKHLEEHSAALEQLACKANPSSNNTAKEWKN